MQDHNQIIKKNEILKLKINHLNQGSATVILFIAFAATYRYSGAGGQLIETHMFYKKFTLLKSHQVTRSESDQ